MADEIDQEAEARRQLEEYQRQQAAAQVTASQNQPNAIPAEPAVNAASRVQPSPVGDPNNPQGNFIDRGGANLGQTGQVPPAGATGIQGVLSPQEQAFWAANPNGAVKDPSTGNLVGLGTVAPPPTPVGPDGMVTVNAGLGPPSTPYNQQARINTGLGPPSIAAQPQREIPDFVHIPEVNPVLIAQRQNIQNQIATTQNQLQSSSSQRFRGQPSQRDILTQKLNTLTQANNGLGLEHYRQTEEQRKATDQNTKLRDQYSMHQDVMDATKAISQIKAPHGSDEFKSQYFQITDRYPNALKDPAFKANAMKTAQFHDDRAAARERAIAAGLIPQETGFGQKGLSEKYVDPNAVPANVQTRYARLQGNLLDHKEQQAAAEKAKQPYKNASQMHADELEVRLLSDKYPGLKAVAPETTSPKVRKYNPGTQQLE